MSTSGESIDPRGSAAVMAARRKGNTMTAISRRSVAKGAAWAVPTLTVAAGAPAVAASGPCTTAIDFSGGITYNWGSASSTPGATTNQVFTSGGQTTLTGLPSGVTVTKVTYKWWIENRQGQNVPGPGIYFPGNTTSTVKTSCSGSTCNLAGSGTGGWSSSITTTSNLTNVTYPDGTSRPSWDLNYTWTAGNGAGTYTTDANGCRTFTTGPSGRLTINYNGVTAPQNGTTPNANEFLTVTATLSNGQTVTYTSQQNLTNSF